MNTKFSFHNLASVAVILVILSGCATYQAQKVGPTVIQHAREEIPEDQLMDVGILVFQSKEITEEAAEDEDVLELTVRVEEPEPAPPAAAPEPVAEPAPEVDSAVLVGVTRERRLAERDEDELWRLVQAGFRERRKMIHNVLARQLPGLDRARVGAALEASAIAPDRRPQTLSVDEWLALRAALAPLP